ncbi:MAG: UvrD-helicase domain-containing protein, partial [Alphaproteobacteria bacterium]
MSIPDQPARDKAIRSRGENLWIEAGAGTGKTTLLVARIFSLLTDPDDPVRLRDLAAITFTEKAAGELKVEIRQKIEDALQKNPPAGEAELLQTALRDLEIAAIDTLHAFAKKVLTERPLEAGIDPEPQVLNEDAFNRLLAEVYNRWFDEQVQQPNETLRWYLAQREIYERHSKWDWLWKLANKICRDQDVLLDAETVSQFTLADAREQLLARAQELQAQTEANCTDENDKAYVNSVEVWPAIQTLPTADDRNAFFDALEALPRINLQGGSGKNWGKEALAENKALRKSLREDHIAWISGLRNAENVWKLFALAQSFAREFEKEKRARGALSFTDLLTRAVALLRDRKDVRRYFQKRYRYLL